MDGLTFYRRRWVFDCNYKSLNGP